MSWGPQTNSLNYHLVYAVSTAHAYPSYNQYNNNALLLLVTTLFHEYVHTLGSHIHATATPLELGGRGWVVEELIFGGRLKSVHSPTTSGDDYHRIKDLSLSHGTHSSHICEILCIYS